MKKLLYTVCLVMALAACSSIDCPLNNVVYAKYKLKGDVTKLEDYLTVTTNRADGNDTILLNLLQNTDSFSLPVSYGQTVDELCLVRTNGDAIKRDTIWMEKTNEPHFESVDCKPSIFHTITGVKTTHNSIDSIVINCKEVTYDETKPHFYIYFGHRD